MASIDDLITNTLIVLNRTVIQDGAGNDITQTFTTGQVNAAIHALERRLVSPYQTYTFNFTTVFQQQTYPLQEATLPTGVGDYRSTRSLTIPWQTAMQKWGAGQRLNYLPHALARVKYQLAPVGSGVPTVPGTGAPVDYSIFDDVAAGIYPAYWLWPPPDAVYTIVVDQLRFLVDLVAAQAPPQTNWFTREVPDLVLWQAALTMARMLGDDTRIARFTDNRKEAYDAAYGLMSQLQFDEVSAGMVEVG